MSLAGLDLQPSPPIIHHPVIISNTLPPLFPSQRHTATGIDTPGNKSVASCVLYYVLSMSLYERHFSVTLKNVAPKVRDYRKLPDLKDTHLLKVQVPLHVQKGCGVGARGLRKGRRERAQDTSPKAIHSHSRRPKMIKILFVQLSHKRFLKFLFCIPGFNADCSHNRGSK